LLGLIPALSSFWDGVQHDGVQHGINTSTIGPRAAPTLRFALSSALTFDQEIVDRRNKPAGLAGAFGTSEIALRSAIPLLLD
jgi:hypothetical protein